MAFLRPAYSVIGAPVVSGTSGSILFVDSTTTLAQNNANLFWDNSNLRLGLYTTSPTSSLSFGGEVARTIAMERRTTSNTAGLGLTIKAGSATSGATNKAGGGLTFAGGASTGSGAGGSITFQTAPQGTAGTSDNALVSRVIIGSNGALTFSSISTGASGHTGLTHNVTGGALNSGAVTGQIWSYTTTSQIDSGITGLQLQLGSTVIAGDTGGSNVQGFGFEIYLNTDAIGTTHPGGTAVGGFMQASGPGPSGDMTIFLAQTNVQNTASAFIAFSSRPNIFNAGITLANYTGLYIGNFGSNAGGIITNTYGVYLEDLTVDNASAYAIYSLGGKSVHVGNVFLGGTTTPTAKLHLGAGTASANTAPLKFTSGTVLTTPESGTIEYDGNFFYLTP